MILTTTPQEQDNGDSNSTGPVVPSDDGTVASEVLPERTDEPTGDGISTEQCDSVANGNDTSVSDDDYSEQHSSLPDGEHDNNDDQSGHGRFGTGSSEQLSSSDTDSSKRRSRNGREHSGERNDDTEQGVSFGGEKASGGNVEDGPVPPVISRVVRSGLDKRRHEVIPLEIQASKVSKWWPLIRGGVEEVLGKNSPGLIPEDVYSFLVQQRAWLVIAVNKETKRYEGFIVLAEELPNAFVEVPDVLIWIAYSKVPGTAVKLFPHVEKAAKNKGYKRIAFHSARDGWIRRAKTFGFSLTERVYHKRL